MADRDQRHDQVLVFDLCPTGTHTRARAGFRAEDQQKCRSYGLPDVPGSNLTHRAPAFRRRDADTA